MQLRKRDQLVYEGLGLVSQEVVLDRLGKVARLANLRCWVGW